MVYIDDTGWRIAGKAVQMMGFGTDQTTVYQIRDQHRTQEVGEIIPGSHEGVIVTLIAARVVTPRTGRGASAEVHGTHPAQCHQSA